MNTKKIRGFILLILLCGLLCVVSAQAQQGRFRITLNGFFVNHQTFEGARVTDGMGDEVSLFSNFGLVDASGRLPLTTIGNWEGGTIGAVPPNSLQFGTASTTGGLLTGNAFPSMQPWRRVITTNRSPTPPTFFFEVDIVRDSTAAVIIPTIWESDGASDLRFKRDYQTEVTNSREEIAAEVRRLINFPPPLDLSGFLRSGQSMRITPPMLLAYGVPQDRPIGMRESGVQFGFEPKVLVLTYETADFISRTSFGSETENVVGIVPVRYTDASGLGGGDYTLFLQVERIDTPITPIPGQTQIHISDEQNADVSEAEVYINGQRRGTTDSSGTLSLPTMSLNNGDRIVGRKRIMESSTGRAGHQTGSTQNWKYRVYLTTMPVSNTGALSPFVVSNPAVPQELRLNRSSTMVGVHLVASVEWDASSAEIQSLQDKLSQVSQKLFNATDGQFFFEQIEVLDMSNEWGNADIQISANWSLRANAVFGGFFGGGGYMSLHRNSSPYVYTHEFAHYGLSLGDEYSDNDGNLFCTRNVDSTTSAFGWTDGNYQGTASCLMWNSAEKFCSDVSSNRHARGTRQGDTDCWTSLLRTYRDTNTPERWILQSPNTRGVIPGTLPAIPINDWQTRFTVNNRSAPQLCVPQLFHIWDYQDRPVSDVNVFNRTTGGANILQGKSRTDDSATMLLDETGDMLVTGLHVGDEVQAGGGAFRVTSCDLTSRNRSFDQDKLIFGDLATVNQPVLFGNVNYDRQPISTQKSNVIRVNPPAFRLSVSLEPLPETGQARVSVRTDAELKLEPQVEIILGGNAKKQNVTLKYDLNANAYVGQITQLPDNAKGFVQVSAADKKGNKEILTESFSITALISKRETDVFSADGQLSVTIPANALPEAARLSITSSEAPISAVPDNFVMVGNSFKISASTREKLNQPGVIRFQLPNLPSQRFEDGYNGTAGYDLSSFEIRRYNETSGVWEGVGGVLLPEVAIITLRTDKLGSYILVARPLFKTVQKTIENKQTVDKYPNDKFAVTDAGLKADEMKISGKCPVLVNFTGYITTNGAGPVTYVFSRSDGATSPVQTLNFTGAGTQAVTTNWTLGGAGLTSYEGWQTLKILSPNELVTQKEAGGFMMNCEK